MNRTIFDASFSRWSRLRLSWRLIDGPSRSLTATNTFDPHVSLLYGLFPESLKQEIINSLPPDLPSAFPVTRLQLIRADSTNPQDWQVVETLDL